MSKTLQDHIRRFLARETSITVFVDQFIDEWRRERDSGELPLDAPVVSRLLSSAFCIADMYNPNDDREAYEFDEGRVRSELLKLMEALNL